MHLGLLLVVALLVQNGCSMDLFDEIGDQLNSAWKGLSLSARAFFITLEKAQSLFADDKEELKNNIDWTHEFLRSVESEQDALARVSDEVGDFSYITATNNIDQMLADTKKIQDDLAAVGSDESEIMKVKHEWNYQAESMYNEKGLDRLVAVMQHYSQWGQTTKTPANTEKNSGSAVIHLSSVGFGLALGVLLY